MSDLSGVGHMVVEELPAAAVAVVAGQTPSGCHWAGDWATDAAVAAAAVVCVDDGYEVGRRGCKAERD